jgi:hypothetical protein
MVALIRNQRDSGYTLVFSSFSWIFLAEFQVFAQWSGSGAVPTIKQDNQRSQHPSGWLSQV